MKLIIGLGNAESRYDTTRHNVGFWLLDHIARGEQLVWKQSDKFHVCIAETSYHDEKVLLIKPTTYYNQVGESARAVMDFYKLSPEDILIIHDDLALPLGTIRTRMGGSDGGNNGLKSLSAHIGEQTARLRIGVWTDEHIVRDKTDVVLGKFTSAEITLLTQLLPKLELLVQQFITGTFEATTHQSS